MIQRIPLKKKENSRHQLHASCQQMLINPFSPERLLSVQQVQPEGFQQWSWKCWLRYLKHNISVATAPRTLQFGTLTATWMFYNITEFHFSSHGGDVTVYFWHKPTEFAHSLFCSCVCFCLYGPFNCISFHQFSWRLSVFWLFFRSFLCLIGPFNFISLYESLLQPYYNP